MLLTHRGKKIGEKPERVPPSQNIHHEPIRFADVGAYRAISDGFIRDGCAEFIPRMFMAGDGV